MPGAHDVTAAFAPDDPTEFNPVIATQTITIDKADPVITWANPAAIINPAPLTATQLNASANVPGNFVYTPAAGTVLNVGLGQTLSTAFTPTDISNYNTATAAATIDVLAALRVAGAERTSSAATELSPESAESLLPAAILWWQSQGLTAADAARLAEIEVVVAPLPGNVLGASAPGSSQIWLDTNAAGYGWNVDATPTADSEINRQSAIGNWQSVDLLTVLAHELGHVIGRDHDDDHDVMDAFIVPGGSPAALSLDAPQASRLWLRPDSSLSVSSLQSPAEWDVVRLRADAPTADVRLRQRVRPVGRPIRFADGPGARRRPGRRTGPRGRGERRRGAPVVGAARVGVRRTAGPSGLGLAGTRLPLPPGGSRPRFA